MKFNNSIISKFNSKATIQYLALLLILFLSLNLNISCEKGTEPEQLKPGRRDYVWTEDTLDVANYDYMTFRDIVGNSPDDIWLGTLDATSSAEFWHYDGKEWKSMPFPGFAATALLLMDDNSLWAGSKQSYIYKMENGDWSKSYKIELEGYDKIAIYGMSGETNNNIYAVGWATKYSPFDYKAIILHFDGIEWKFVDIPDTRVGLHRIMFQENINKYFIQGMNDDLGFLDKAYIFDGKNLDEIMSTYKECNISKINGKVYVDSDRKIYKYKGGKLELWKDFTGTDFLGWIIGRTESDFFSSSGYVGLLHYNGSDMKTIYETHLFLISKIVFEKEIFVAAEDDENHKYIILHGKLKD